MKQIVLMLGLCALAACGADGDPLRPTGAVGVSVGSGGVTPRAAVGVTTGNLTVGFNN